MDVTSQRREKREKDSKSLNVNNNLQILVDVTEKAVGKACFSLKNKSKNKFIHQLFQQDIVSTPSALSYWSTFVGNIN